MKHSSPHHIRGAFRSALRGDLVRLAIAKDVTRRDATLQTRFT
jgi:hypothetical protein